MKVRVSEKVFQRQVIQLARLRGWLCCHFRPARTLSGGWRTAVSGDGAGWPELICVRGAEIFAAELKSATGKLSAEQIRWLEALEAAGVDTYVWRPTAADWREIEAILKEA